MKVGVNEKWAEKFDQCKWLDEVFIRLRTMKLNNKHKIEDLLTNRDAIKKDNTKQAETDGVDANI